MTVKFNYIRDNFENFLKGSFITYLIVIVTGFFIVCFKNLVIGPDGGYYVKNAIDIKNGYNYYTQIYSEYSPLVLYFFAFISKIFDSEKLDLFYGILIGVYIINTFLFDIILRLFKLNIWDRFLFTFAFLTSVFLLDGYDVYLEPFVLLFQLMLIFHILKFKEQTNYLYVGFLLFLAFYAKQYGLFMAPVLLYNLWTSNFFIKEKLIKVSLMTLGFIMPLIIIYFCQRIYFQLDFFAFIIRILGINQTLFVSTGVAYDFDDLMRSLVEIFFLFPFLLLLISKIKFNHQSKIIFLTSICSLMILKFASYMHYFQLIVPYLFLLLAINFDTFSKYKKYIFYGMFMIFMFQSFKYLKDAHNFKTIEIKSKTSIQSSLNQILTPNSKVYLFGLGAQYYYYCNFNSTSLSKIGYSFANVSSVHIVQSYFKKGDIILILKTQLKKKDLNYFSIVQNTGVQINGTDLLIIKKKF